MSKTRAILEAVFDEAPLAEPCQACQAGLAAYVDAELAGQPAAGLFPAVSEHLTTCAACRLELAELRSLLELERQGRLEQPPVPGEFDFGYLQIGPFAEERSNLDIGDSQIGPFAEERSNRSGGWRMNALGRLVIQFSADLLSALQPPTLQPGYLKGSAPSSLSYDLTDQIEDLNVRIHVEASRRDPQTATLEVEVDIPSHGGWPNLAGSAVILGRGPDELIDEQETDAFGKVTFEDVRVEDLPLLIFEIAVA